MSFTPIETQEQFDAAISERIGRVNAKHESAIADMQAKLDALTQENASLNQSIKDSADKYATADNTIADLTAKVKSYEVASVKARVAREAGIPFEMAERLRGETEEEIKADAEALAKLIPKQKAPLGSTEPVGVKSDDPYKASLKQTLKSMKGN